MEEEQLPGYRGPEQRSSTDIFCDCGVSLCVGFTVISFLFLNAWNALETPIPPDQMSQALFPFIASTSIVLVLWLIHKVYSKLVDTTEAEA